MPSVRGRRSRRPRRRACRSPCWSRTLLPADWRFVGGAWRTKPLARPARNQKAVAAVTSDHHVAFPSICEDQQRHAPGRLSRRVHPCQRQAGRRPRDAGPFDRRGKELGPCRTGRRRSDDGRPQRRDRRDGRRHDLRHLRQVSQGGRPGRAPWGVADDQQGRGPIVVRPGEGEQDRRRSHAKPRDRPGQRARGWFPTANRRTRPPRRASSPSSTRRPARRRRSRRRPGASATWPTRRRSSGRPTAIWWPSSAATSTRNCSSASRRTTVGRGRSACPAAFRRSSRRPT